MPKQIVYALLALFALTCGQALAADAAPASRALIYAPVPQDYVRNLLNGAVKDGMQPIREFVEQMGIRSPQIDQTLDNIDGLTRKSPDNLVRILAEVDSGGALRQVYAYSYHGNNAWFFWRFDFVMTDKGWAVSAFNFDNDYAKVKGAELAGAISNPVKP